MHCDKHSSENYVKLFFHMCRAIRDELQALQRNFEHLIALAIISFCRTEWLADKWNIDKATF